MSAAFAQKRKALILLAASKRNGAPHGQRLPGDTSQPRLKLGASLLGKPASAAPTSRTVRTLAAAPVEGCPSSSFYEGASPHDLEPACTNRSVSALPRPNGTK